MAGEDLRGPRWPARLLTNGNRDLARDRIWTWTLPALPPQAASDLLAVDGPAPVGMASNDIPKLKRRQGDRTRGQWQAETEGRPFPFGLAA